MVQNQISGYSAVGSALDLGACSTPAVRAKSEIPGSLENTVVLALHGFRIIPQKRRLTTSLTTTAEQENRISGCSSDGRARGLGPRGRWFETSHSDQKTSEISDFRGFLLFHCLLRRIF